jgi:glycosyltransferase involved in cell wall biosynthesis
MKILFISDVIYPWVKGGSEYRIARISECLGKNNQIDFLCGKWWEGSDRCGHFHGLPIIKNLYQGNRSAPSAISFTVSLLRALPKIQDQYDIIEINQSPMLHFALLDILRHANFARKAVLIGAIHEVWQEYWLEYAGALQGLFGYCLEYETLKKLDHILTISFFNRGKLARWRVPDRKVSVIRPGVDCSLIEKVSPSGEESDIVFAGRLVPEKRLDILIRAVKVLRETYQRNKIRLVIVGGGPQLDELRSFAAASGLSRNVTFTNRVEDHTRVFALMKSSKIFVYPAPPEGGWSIAIIEANASGLPALTSRRSSIGAGDEVVQNGQNGFVLNDATPEQFALFIDRLLGDEELRRRVSESSKLYAKKFDWYEIAMQSQEVFRSLLAQRGEDDHRRN